MGATTSGGNKFLSSLVSIALHGVACVFLFISYHARTKMPELKTIKVSVVRPEPPPKVETPKPPKVEPKVEPPPPPKVEPPPPPKVEPPPPPKVEPPKPPKVEPPPPPKEVKPLPQPKPLKPKVEPPKPQPKVEQPKPQPKVEQPKPQPKKLSMEERLKASETVKTHSPKQSNLKNRLNEILKNSETRQPATKPQPMASAGVVVETANYAEQIARPYIQRHWIQPVKGELDVANPSPVEISFIVYASGGISNARITKRSNSRVMNASVEQFLKDLRRMEPLSAVGSKASELQIAVNMVLTN